MKSSLQLLLVLIASTIFMVSSFDVNAHAPADTAAAAVPSGCHVSSDCMWPTQMCVHGDCVEIRKSAMKPEPAIQGCEQKDCALGEICKYGWCQDEEFMTSV